MKNLSMFIILLLASPLWALSFDLYDLGQQRNVDLAQLQVDDDALILLGETHYEERMTRAQAYVIENLVQSQGAYAAFNVAWEFMNYPDQVAIEKAYQDYTSERINVHELFELIFPNQGQDQQQNLTYEPLFATAKKYEGNMIATNAPRPWKRVIVSEGIDKLPGHQVPSLMRRGSDEYFERFFAAIGGHGDPSALEGYFMAQSYTDAVMAEQLSKTSHLTFMIVGHFHTDFGHGLPDYLASAGNRQVINIRLVDTLKTSVQEINSLKNQHDKYGYVADYLLLIK